MKFYVTSEYTGKVQFLDMKWEEQIPDQGKVSIILIYIFKKVLW